MGYIIITVYLVLSIEILRLTLSSQAQALIHSNHDPDYPTGSHVLQRTAPGFKVLLFFLRILFGHQVLHYRRKSRFHLDF